MHLNWNVSIRGYRPLRDTFYVPLWGFDAHSNGRNASWAFRSVHPWPSQQPFNFHSRALGAELLSPNNAWKRFVYPYQRQRAHTPYRQVCLYRWELLELCRSKITNVKPPAVFSYQTIGRQDRMNAYRRSQRKTTGADDSKSTQKNYIPSDFSCVCKRVSK